MTSPISQLPIAEQTDSAVRSRYSHAAQSKEPALCCPVDYNPQLLEKLPAEIIEKDYGCGDPSAHVRTGETVLDLGSGGGKICYLAAQIVGPAGRVIGVDCNHDMLALARKYQQEMADKLGFGNVEFHYARIQDLALGLDLFQEHLGQLDASASDYPLQVLHLARRLRAEQPLIPDNSVDCVVSNCVLNLVNTEDRRQLFSELYRVLKCGGRAVISDIVSDEDVPEHLRADGQLWSGCVSGAWREDRFLDEFAEAGFHGLGIESYQQAPWQVVEGIEFRSMTVVAYKGQAGPGLERQQAVMYRGPFERVCDDEGNSYRRGQRVAVSDTTYQALMQPPYEGLFEAIAPHQEIPVAEAEPFPKAENRLRSPAETKGAAYRETTQPCCGTEGCC